MNMKWKSVIFRQQTIHFKNHNPLIEIVRYFIKMIYKH